MKNPCTRECPDRTPGCECEKRRAWLWLREQEKEKRRKVSLVENYISDAARRNKRANKR